jgi:NAD(P)-dependent dehydrogenase (short-subunit alcohol dehydrogenase family)
VAVVSGFNSGIGYHTTRALLERGAEVGGSSQRATLFTFSDVQDVAARFTLQNMRRTVRPVPGCSCST